MGLDFERLGRKSAKADFISMDRNTPPDNYREAVQMFSDWLSQEKGWEKLSDREKSKGVEKGWSAYVATYEELCETAGDPPPSWLYSSETVPVEDLQIGMEILLGGSPHSIESIRAGTLMSGETSWTLTVRIPTRTRTASSLREFRANPGTAPFSVKRNLGEIKTEAFRPSRIPCHPKVSLAETSLVISDQKVHLLCGEENLGSLLLNREGILAYREGDLSAYAEFRHRVLYVRLTNGKEEVLARSYRLNQPSFRKEDLEELFGFFSDRARRAFE